MCNVEINGDKCLGNLGEKEYCKLATILERFMAIPAPAKKKAATCQNLIQKHKECPFSSELAIQSQDYKTKVAQKTLDFTPEDTLIFLSRNNLK